MKGIITGHALIKRLRLLRQTGHSLGEICRKTHLSKTTVYGYIRDIDLTEAQQKTIKNKNIAATRISNQRRRGISRPYNRIQVPKEPWLVDFVTCLAHFYFDGSQHGSTASYYNRSQSLIDEQRGRVAKFFGLKGKILPQSTDVTRLDYYSIELVKYLLEARSKLFTNILHMNREIQRGFLQAFFDDEGSIDFGGTAAVRRVRGYQKDFRILQIILQLLKKFHIDSKIDVITKCVTISRLSNLQRFQKEVNFSSGISMNPMRKNSRHRTKIEKRELLKLALSGVLP